MLKTPIPPFVKFLLSRLKTSGYQAFIVGGAVRDAYLKRPVTDWDIATSARSEEIQSMFSDIRQFTLKKETVTLVHDGCSFEITPFRGLENNIKSDLALRDFTINAMAFDPEQQCILDYFGGRKDIGKKRIRATGDPRKRFQEDPIRLLRGVRLAHELNFKIAESTKYMMREMASLLKTTAPERIRDELMRILLTLKPSTGLRLMNQTGMLIVIVPELLEGYLKRQNAHHRFTIFKHLLETTDNIEAAPALRVAALFHDAAKPRVREKVSGKWHFLGHEEKSSELSAEIMARLKFSKDMIKTVSTLIRHHGIYYESRWTDSAIRRLIRRVGAEQLEDLLKLRRADILAHGLHNQGLELLDELHKRITEISNHPISGNFHKLAIDGNKVKAALDLDQGPAIGRILKRLHDIVSDQPELNTEKGLFKVLEQIKTPV